MLNKYFEGETNIEEERLLRVYFNQENLPDHLKELAPIFTYIDNEQLAVEALKEITDAAPATTLIKKKKQILMHSFFISAVAAASIITVFFLFSPTNSSSGANENYAWINGKRITDKDMIKIFAEKSLENVSSTENIFMEQMSAIFDENIGEE